MPPLAPGDTLYYAEPSFLAFVDAPELVLRNDLLRVMSRFREVEKHLRGEQSGYPGVAKMTAFALRSLDARARTGFEWSPASIDPSDRTWRRVVATALPYYVGTTVGASGIQLGWEPRIHLPRTNAWALSLPVEAQHVSFATPWREERWLGAAAPSVTWIRGGTLLTEVSAGVRTVWTWDGTCRPFERCGLTWETGALLAAGKLRATVSRYPAQWPGSARNRWAASLAVADVNGILYWLMR